MDKRPKKHIGEIIYTEAKEYNNLLLFVKDHIIKHGNGCKYNVSQKAAKEFNLDYPTAGNMIAAYIESLQNEIEILPFKLK